jgi:hypothetical protein
MIRIHTLKSFSIRMEMMLQQSLFHQMESILPVEKTVNGHLFTCGTPLLLIKSSLLETRESRAIFKLLLIHRLEKLSVLLI